MMSLSYTQDGAAFSFIAGPATQMYCEGLMDAETALRSALSDADTVRSPGGVIELVDAAGLGRRVTGRDGGTRLGRDRCRDQGEHRADDHRDTKPMTWERPFVSA